MRTTYPSYLGDKGFDDLIEVKAQVAKRWVDAVNAEESYGVGKYAIARRPEEVEKRVEEAARGHKEMEAFEGVRLLKKEAERRIEWITAEERGDEG